MSLRTEPPGGPSVPAPVAPTRRPAEPPATVAKRVLRLASAGSLGTLAEDGGPFASLVTVAATPGGAPILLLSDLALHTQNLKRDSRASLLLVAPGGEGGDPLAGARLTLAGTMAVDADPTLRRRFLAVHPEAEGYAAFADFGFYRMTVRGGHLVAGFGRIVGLSPEALATNLAGADDLLATEEGAVAHMNEDHRETMVLYATRLLGLPAADWRATGVDPEGLDMRAGGLAARLPFPEPVRSGGPLRATLKRLADAARAKDTPVADTPG